MSIYFNSICTNAYIIYGDIVSKGYYEQIIPICIQLFYFHIMVTSEAVASPIMS